jgi:nicotinamidase-related amidase
MSSVNPPRSALLIVDMQVGLLDGPEPPHARERLLANVNALIERARRAGTPIFAARHTGPQGSPIAAGNPLWQVHPAVAIDMAADRVFDKTRPSCFAGTGLAQWLAELQVSALVIAGLKTQYCIDTTCRVAAELGFQPLLAADAHSCMDTPELSASAIIAHHNATLGGPFVRLLNTDAIRFGG